MSNNNKNKMSDYLTDLKKYEIEKSEVKAEKSPRKVFKPKPDPVLLKLFPDPHPLSIEHQQYFLKLTEGVFGFNEQVRNESLLLIANDFHVRFLAPYFATFLKETVEVNIALPDLSLLIYAVRMVKSLLVNPYISMKEYLHVIIPAILSCVLSKKISKYNYDNHWTLRDFSAQVVATICYNYSNKFNEIKKRVTRIYLKAVQDEQKSISTLYGGLKGLSCLGEDVVKFCIIPFMPFLSKRIYTILEKTSYLGESNVEVKQVKRVSDLLLTITGPIFLKYENTNDGGISYVQRYGYLGYSLYNHIKNLEKIEAEKSNNNHLLSRFTSSIVMTNSNLGH